MKDTPRQHFRWAPHVSGIAQLKPRDYEPDGDLDALNFYDAWAILRGSPRALDIGDALETDSGELRICKYVGFEEARWVVAELRSPAIPDVSHPDNAAATPVV